LAGGTSARRAEIGHQRRAMTRQRLLTAAARVVAERGTAGVTIDDFIKSAGVARGTFYNYFKTRDELVGALWQHIGDAPLRTIRKAHAFDGDPAYRLTTGLRMTILKASADHVWGWLFYRMGLGDLVFRDELRAYPMADIQAGIQSGRFMAIDPEVACDYFLGVSIMAIKAVMVDSRPADYAEQCAFLVLRGLGMESEQARQVSQRSLPALRP